MITKTDLMHVTGGTPLKGSSLGGKYSAIGVQFDSRAVRGGELFVAMKGEAADGNAFARAAYDRGASLILADNPALLTDFPEPDRVVIVPNSLLAFQQLATFWREKLRTPVIAVTGSVGKTTAKEMLASVLVGKGPGAYSVKSYNNHVGVPTTIMSFSAQHLWGVLEMGMNHAGELSILSEIGRPNVAVVTTIAPAHIEFFKDLDGIADAKLEIVDGLKPGGVLIVNADNAVLMKALDRKLPGRPLVVRTFGTQVGCDAQISQVQSHGLEGVSFTLSLCGQRHAVRLKCLGRVNATNAAAAALAAVTLFPELPLATIIEGLERFTAPLMRLNILSLADGRSIIDDSYNANPVAMRSMLEIAAEISASGKKVGLVLGGMRELGSQSTKLHSELAQAVSDVKPSFLAIKGEYSEEYARQLPHHVPVVKIVDDAQGAREILSLPFEVLCVKGSRGIGLDRVVSALNPSQNARQPKDI